MLTVIFPVAVADAFAGLARAHMHKLSKISVLSGFGCCISRYLLHVYVYNVQCVYVYRYSVCLTCEHVSPSIECMCRYQVMLFCC